MDFAVPVAGSPASSSRSIVVEISSESNVRVAKKQPKAPSNLPKRPDRCWPKFWGLHATEVDGKLEEIIEGIPSPEDRHYLEKTFIGLIERSGGAPLQADVATVIAETINRDNDHKFEYLCKKLDQEENESVRGHELRIQQQKDQFSIIKPAFFFSLFILAACTAGGVWLCYEGKEVLGAALITAVWAGALGFLAGMGSSDFFKTKTK